MIAKPRPRMLDKLDAKRAREATDRAENVKVKARSGGQCEVQTLKQVRYGGMSMGRPMAIRCALRASHIHHLISGIGRRNVGKSIEAAHKLHVCERCHDKIHGHVLIPVNQYEREAAATVRFERIK